MKRHLFSALGLGLFVTLAMGSDENQGGTLLGSQMDPYAAEYLADHQMLESGETVLVYYDATISLDGTEAAFVTDQRVVYHKAGAETSIYLSDVSSIETQQDELGSDIIDVFGVDGTRLRIEVAPLNDGDLFISELQRAVSSVR